METISNQQATLEEGLTQFLTRFQTTQKDLSNTSLSVRDAANLLYKFYRFEIQNRKRAYIESKDTLPNIAKLAKYLSHELPLDHFGVCLCGKCGNGKTTLLRAFQKEIIYLVEKGYYSDPKPILLIEDARSILNKATNFEEIEKIKKADFLAIDDLGLESSEVSHYGNIITPIVEIIEYRYTNRLFTIFTTNLSADNIKAKYGIRVYDRFKEMVENIPFESESFRN